MRRAGLMSIVVVALVAAGCADAADQDPGASTGAVDVAAGGTEAAGPTFSEALEETDGTSGPPRPAGDELVADLPEATVPTVTLYKSPTCECCGGHEDHLREAGLDVEVVIHDEIADLKAAFGVPETEWSCHTSEVGGYVVEGHVPVEAIVALLGQAPDVDGIALAGMPSGSPGMPGDQEAPFVVTTVADGEVVGVLGEF